jgi:hypothetical protein
LNKSWYNLSQWVHFHAFAALKADGSITTWGESSSGGKNASNVPTDKGYTKIYSNQYAFAALKADGSIKAWVVYAFSKSLHEFLKSPHAVIDPLALRAAKAPSVE